MEAKQNLKQREALNPLVIVEDAKRAILNDHSTSDEDYDFASDLLNGVYYHLAGYKALGA